MLRSPAGSPNSKQRRPIRAAQQLAEADPAGGAFGAAKLACQLSSRPLGG